MRWYQIWYMMPLNIRNYHASALLSQQDQPTCHAQGRVLKFRSAKMMASARQVAAPPFSPSLLASLDRTLELQRVAMAGRKTPNMAASRRIWLEAGIFRSGTRECYCSRQCITLKKGYESTRRRQQVVWTRDIISHRALELCAASASCRNAAV
jgi:hypothetical protein